MNELKRVILKPYAKDKFELVEFYECRFDLGRFKNELVLIPKGFITNGANIPRIFWSIYPPNSPEYLSAVVVHDFLCEKAQTREDYKIADMCLKQALQMLGVNKFKIWVFYTACDLYHGLKFLFKKESEMIALREVIPYTTARNYAIKLAKKKGLNISVQVVQIIRLDTHTPQRTHAAVMAKKDLPRLLEFLKERAQEARHLTGFHHNLRYCVRELEKYLQKEQG